MKLKTIFNIFDLNFILCFCGFSIFTTFVDSSIGSIVYRGATLMLSIICLFLSGLKFGKNTLLKIFVGIFGIILIKITLDFYLFGVDNIYKASANNAMLFAYGVTFIPMLSVIGSWKRIHTKTCILILFVSLFIILGIEYFKTDITVKAGRAVLNPRQSFLTYGDSGAYLAIISLTILSRLRCFKFRTVLSVLAILGILIGFYSIGKAASRGPLIGCIAGIIYVAANSTKMIKNISIITVVVACISYIAVLGYMEEAAPVLYSRVMSTVEDNDTSGRDEIFEDALQIIDKSPIVGGNPVILEQHGSFTCFHNCYLDVAVGTGVIGGIIFLFIIGSLAINSIRLGRKMNTPWDLFIMGMLWFFMFRSLSGVAIVANTTYDICIALALIIIYNKKHSQYEHCISDKKLFADQNGKIVP